MQVNLVLRAHQARGAKRDQWDPVERLDHLGLERKETKDLQVSQEVVVSLVLPDLWGLKVKWESKVPLGCPGLLAHKATKVKQGLLEQKVTEEHQDHKVSKGTGESRENADHRVNQDNLDHKAQLDQLDLKDLWVRWVCQV